MVTSAIMFESRGVLYTFKHSTNFPYKKLHVLVRASLGLFAARSFFSVQDSYAAPTPRRAARARSAIIMALRRRHEPRAFRCRVEARFD